MNTTEHLVIYTVLLGNKEKLGSPLALVGHNCETDLKLEFFCITDNRTLSSDTWKFIYLDELYLPPERLSRRPKILVNDYFPDYKYSLYIDNVVTFRRLPNSEDLKTDQPYLFKMYRHAFRQNLFQEADAIVSLAYDDVQTIDTQLDYYQNLTDVNSISPIHTCTVMFREHNHPAIIKQGQIWWENFLCFSKRDQMSFDFSVKLSGCNIESLPGYKHENDFVYGTDNAHDDRIKANFDEVKYAWVNRHIPEAIANPKKHFLSDPTAQGELYSKKSDLFEHICYTCKSSLGSYYAPRRNIAENLSGRMMPLRGQQGRCLIVRVADTSNPCQFSEQEFIPAAQAISMFLNPYTINTFEVSLTDVNNQTLVFNREEEQFDTAIILGVREENIELIIKKFSGLMNNRGRLIILTTGVSKIKAIYQAEHYLQEFFKMECRSSLYNTWHDSQANNINNSLIVFEW